MRRVVVTGLGLVTPLGGDVETTWKNILAGKSGAGHITKFDASDKPSVEHMQGNRVKEWVTRALRSESMGGVSSPGSPH